MNKKEERLEHRITECLKSYNINDIDFLGINITDNYLKTPKCKIYLSQTVSKCNKHPLTEFVQKKEMLRYYADVYDADNPRQIRIDLALKNRTDKNMKDLYDYLESIVPFFSNGKTDVIKTAGMSITSLDNYHYASNYHIGLIEKHRVISMLKFHFFTRWCAENPDYPCKKGYMDREYLEYLKSISIYPFKFIADKLENFLIKNGGHLWMAGLDMEDEVRKYKIYIKNPITPYSGLQDILSEWECEQLDQVINWNKKQPEWRLVGFALAMDTFEIESCNLYYIC